MRNMGITASRPKPPIRTPPHGDWYFRRPKSYEPPGYGVPDKKLRRNPMPAHQTIRASRASTMLGETGQGRGIGRIALILLGAVVVKEILLK